ncbi:MAG TPA: DEAD/DEAH box helicase family protein [Candidatus Paceibacterota bacterium]
MPTPLNIGTRDIPLRLARTLTSRVNESWASGELIAKVTPITRDLLTFWFMEPHTDTRYTNFHEGQRQAILNTIYLHEILGVKAVKDIYENIEFELLSDIDMSELKKAKYEIPKYAIKMATGTGKTWVMHALIIWQYLNAKYEETRSGRYSKNFLLVAPGLIVYERLLDAYLGKENIDGGRQFETSDIYQFRDIFVPQSYREDVFGFVQNAVARKQEIGSKVTGDGLIAIANWHLFMSEDEEVREESALDDPSGVVRDIFPVRPGISGGNVLDSLDAEYLSGREIDYLASLPDLMVMNDEAHHIHENKAYGEVKEVEWQKSLNIIAKNKAVQFIQIDFSATPYDVTGSGQNRVKHYFPHIIVDFDLKTAIRSGLVKTIAIDKRKELVDLPLDYNAIRENGIVVGLSDGQKMMLRAGLNKLQILEKHFTEFTQDKSGVSNKHPKMLIMSEDTFVTPFIEEFLKGEGLAAEDVMRIDSNRKGEVPEEEWFEIKQRLFNIDKHAHPKVIVSVLMLREGFDVNNICVIVPLRSSSAPILLEQTIGRGLRLMWREPEFEEVKADNRKKLLVEKREPNNYLDLLTIVEHPAFTQFYDELLKEGLLGEIDHDPKGGHEVLGDIIKVGLKTNFKNYDLFWPVIIRDADDELAVVEINVSKLEVFNIYPLDDLKKFFSKDGERFIAEEMTVKTRFGEYVVDAALFKSQSYNEYLQKIVGVVVNRMARISQRKNKVFPALQINNVAIVGTVDTYIRSRLFGQNLDPFADNNWKILLLKNGLVTDHIVKEIGKAVFEMQQAIKPTEAKVEKRYFSEITELRMRENFSVDIAKTIYERLAYPSNKGEFEKNLMLYADTDSNVESLIKVSEYYHSFATISYIRTDGLLSLYSPDFIIKTGKKIYIIETKADKDLNDPTVKQKQLATLDWIKRINSLDAKVRMEREWSYILLGENHFYSLKENNATIEEICELARVSEAAIEGRLL